MSVRDPFIWKKEQFCPDQFMLVPTMACQAGCSYCFAKKGGEVMTRKAAEKAIDFIARTAPADREITLTFHGGEPLLAGEDFYAFILPLLLNRFGRRIRLFIQSNLWGMTDGLAELFRKYRVYVGTSLDGPQDLCDSQRGEGYYAGTTQGMELLRRHHIDAGVICTLTADHADLAAQVYRASTQPYSIHGAVPAPAPEPVPSSAPAAVPVSIPALAPRETGDKHFVNAEQMKSILLGSYEAYRSDPAHSRITTLDAMARGCLDGKGCICTFSGCLGRFAAIAPDGSVFSCQRFAGLKEYCLGNVNDGLSSRAILRSPAFARLREADERRIKACAGCSHWDHCRGGCLYNSIAQGTEKDPYCEAYSAVFERIRLDMAQEMGSLFLGGNDETPVLAMAGDRPHPYDQRRSRERIRDALAKGRQPWSETAGEYRDPYPEFGLNKLYLHLTFKCPLRCSHCYAEAGERRGKPLPASSEWPGEAKELAPERFAQIIREAADSLFRSVVITGGEPLAYPGFDDLCRRLGRIDRKGTKLILRSSFGFPISGKRMKMICQTFDEIIVSVDGDRKTHDARRGEGRYDLTAGNLKCAMSSGAAGKLGLAAVLSREETDGPPGESVRELARDLGIRKVSFRPLLPLGRGKGAQQEEWQLCSSEEILPEDFHIRNSCGLGQNLYVEPDGTAYPCYAWCGPRQKLGGLAQESLQELLARGELYEYCSHDVDSNEKCRNCEVRYLCGGICKAWVKDRENADSGQFDCSSRKNFFMKMAMTML